MVHRDIKPSNLILARHGKKPVVKVLDFGLAKATREGPVEKGLTHEGQMLGTPESIAPEQSLDAQRADTRADIYSLGCSFGLAIVWFAGVLTIKTKNGVIVLENVPENAVVEIDGKKASVSSTVGGPLRIDTSPGTHGLLVNRGYEVLLGKSVTLQPGEELKIPVPVKETVETRPPPSSPSAVAPTRAAAWIRSSAQMEFVRIKGGEFTMGSPGSDADAEPDEKPQHKVRISPFYLGMTEVTQEQYLKVTGRNPSEFSPTGGGRLKVAGQSTARHPVENVSWLDAIKFCNALSKKDVLEEYYKIDGDEVRVPNKSGAGYRLPTEAEWEYACRAGTTTRYSFGDDPRELGEYAWYDASCGMTHPVGQQRPNALGLYDMHGNVWEWCWDGYDVAYYAQSPVDDPPETAGASLRVIRGGSWNDGPSYCRSADRYGYAPRRRNSYLGFRLALGLSGR